MALVEQGGVQGKLGSFDLLIIPRSAVRTQEWMRLGDTWPIKAAAEATRRRAAKITKTGMAPGIRVVATIERKVAYDAWGGQDREGHVWVEIVAATEEGDGAG